MVNDLFHPHIPFVFGNRYRVYNGDMLQVLDQLPDNSMDSCVCDPPYHLTTDSRYGRTTLDSETDSNSARGFMGKVWDGGDIAFQAATWAKVLRVLKPGAHLLAFGGTRRAHRLTSAIEDAGFEIRDSIQWIYGSGMPKSGGLKPAVELITMARKPFDGTRVACVAEWGTGGLQIEESRVESDEKSTRAGGWRPPVNEGYRRPGGSMFEKKNDWEMSVDGRYPSNVILDGSDCVVDCFPVTSSGAWNGERNATKGVQKNNIYGADIGKNEAPREGSTGSAARFFYHAKASKRDRAGSGHPTVKPLALMTYLVRLVTPANGTVLDPFAGSGTTIQAAVDAGFTAVGIEKEYEYFRDIKRRMIAC